MIFYSITTTYIYIPYIKLYLRIHITHNLVQLYYFVISMWSLCRHRLLFFLKFGKKSLRVFNTTAIINELPIPYWRPQVLVTSIKIMGISIEDNMPLTQLPSAILVTYNRLTKEYGSRFMSQVTHIYSVNTTQDS